MPGAATDRLGHAPGLGFTNATVSPQRAPLRSFDPALRPLDALKAWMLKRQTLTPMAPAMVKDGPVSSSDRGDRSTLALPAPFWHASDGGCYIGTGRLDHARSRRRLDQRLDLSRAGARQGQGDDPPDHPGRHGAIIAKNTGTRANPARLRWSMASTRRCLRGLRSIAEGASEYDFAGAIKGAPIEVFTGAATGLPLPAHAEIILEGELVPPSHETLLEGPFGEFTGYYAADKRPCPVMNVTAVHHRNDPILLGSPPMKPPRFHFGLPFRAASIWSNLETAGVGDVVGVWQHVAQLMTVVALRQRYDGHAKRAALIAAANSYMGRLVVVVDDDVDPSNLADVMWAITTRCEPSEQIDIVHNAWSSALDPRIPPDAKARGVTSHSKAIIEACRPFAWKDRFPTTSALSQHEARAIEDKWGAVLKGGK
jgi:4-hydroxy-3-polyprenylbenzoate decarboxylase